MVDSSYKILVIDGNPEETSRIISGLGRKGLSVTVASDSTAAIEIIGRGAPHLLLIDDTVISDNPALWNAITQREPKGAVPVIILLSVEDPEWQKHFLQADDFVIRPFSDDELISRVEHSLWRTYSERDSAVFRYGDLILDMEKRQVYISKRQIDLTFKEYELLKILALGKGKVLTRQHLYKAIWGREYQPGDRTVDVHIRRLRSKIDIEGHSFVETVINVGYRLRTET